MLLQSAKLLSKSGTHVDYQRIRHDKSSEKHLYVFLKLNNYMINLKKVMLSFIHSEL